jgi:hypothetical protein
MDRRVCTAIRLQWTDSATNENGFTTINGSTSRSAGANATMYDWGGLAPGTYMCFKVRAYDPPAQQNWICTTTPVT